MNFTETQPGVWFDDSKQYRLSTATLVKRRNGEPLCPLPRLAGRFRSGQLTLMAVSSV
jgi:hypothetical protein